MILVSLPFSAAHGVTYQGNQAICVEDMLTREYVELTDEQQFSATGTSFIAIHSDKTRLKFLDVLLDLIGAVSGILHILPKLVYFDTVSFESTADLVLDRIQ